MGSGFEIPHRGRSPDFVRHGIALPSFPVDCKAAPVHSDCIAPDSHRIPFSSALEQTPLCYNFIFFRQWDYITFCRIVNPFYGGFVQNVSKAAPHNCVCKSQPSFCSTSAVPKMGNIAQPLPAQAGLRMRHTPCGYIQYSSASRTFG